eukprot:13939909-Alexandrium_andersonii.AAC.1
MSDGRPASSRTSRSPRSRPRLSPGGARCAGSITRGRGTPASWPTGWSSLLIGAFGQTHPRCAELA